jgi:hypothetical protein
LWGFKPLLDSQGEATDGIESIRYKGSAQLRENSRWKCFAGAPVLIEIMGLTGFDWVMLDSEHSGNDPRATSDKEGSMGTVVKYPQRLHTVRDERSIADQPWSATVIVLPVRQIQQYQKAAFGSGFGRIQESPEPQFTTARCAAFFERMCSLCEGDSSRTRRPLRLSPGQS